MSTVTNYGNTQRREPSSVTTDLHSVTATIDGHPPVTISGQAFLRLAGREVDEDIDMPEITIPVDEDFVTARSEWIEAEDLSALGAAVIARYGQFEPLLEMRLRYVWRASYQEVAGRAQWGDTKRLTQMNQHFADADIAIWLAANWFRDQDDPQRAVEAGLYRQLCHIGFTPKGKPIIIGPDFAGFVTELRHYGLWLPSYRSLHREIEQLELPGTERR